jgi:hypothetical protein
MNLEGSNTVRTLATPLTPLSSLEPAAPTRRTARRTPLAAVAVFTALCLGSTQALAQAPSATPTTAPPAAPAAPAAPPAPDHTRSADAPLSVEVPPPPLEPLPPAEPQPPGEPTPPAPPELAPPPEPPPTPAIVGPAPPPSPELPPPGPTDPVGGEKLRKAGVGTMIGGGVLAALGFGLTLAFTIQGHKRHDELASAEDDRQRMDCSRMGSKTCTQLATQIDDLGKQIDSANTNGQIGGATMLTGFLVMAVGGLVYRMGIRKLQPPALGRVKLSPSLGGVVISGRF